MLFMVFTQFHTLYEMTPKTISVSLRLKAGEPHLETVSLGFSVALASNPSFLRAFMLMTFLHLELGVGTQL